MEAALRGPYVCEVSLVSSSDSSKIKHSLLEWLFTNRLSQLFQFPEHGNRGNER